MTGAELGPQLNVTVSVRYAGAFGATVSRARHKKAAIGSSTGQPDPCVPSAVPATMRRLPVYSNVQPFETASGPEPDGEVAEPCTEHELRVATRIPAERRVGSP